MPNLLWGGCMIRIALNSIACSFISLLSRLFFGATTIKDWKHYPNFSITLDTAITTSQLYVYDIQPDVKYARSDKGAVLGYIDGTGSIDLTSYVAHVTWEGTIIIWGPDADPDGMFCIVIPYNTQIQHLLIDSYDVSVVPMPDAAPTFGSTNVRWQPTDVPNHWIHLSPRVDIDVKFNTSTNYPYVDTCYFAQSIDRYDDKKYDAKFVVGPGGTSIENFQLNPVASPQINITEFNAQLDKAALLISMVKHKYIHETACLDNFRKSAIF